MSRKTEKRKQNRECVCVKNRDREIRTQRVAERSSNRDRDIGKQTNRIRTRKVGLITMYLKPLSIGDSNVRWHPISKFDLNKVADDQVFRWNLTLNGITNYHGTL